MAVYVTASGISASALVDRIKTAIKNNTVRTWAFIPQQGFVHVASSGQWNTGGYLEVETSKNPQELILLYKRVPNSTVQTGTFGVLNGRFSEMLLNHFSDFFTEIILKDLRAK